MELCFPFTPSVPAFVLSQKVCLLYFLTCPSSHPLLSFILLVNQNPPSTSEISLQTL